MPLLARHGAFVLTLLLASSGQAQSDSPAPLMLATGRLPSVVELPLYLRLYRVHLPTAQHAAYKGAYAMLYDLSGAPTIAVDSGPSRTLETGTGAFVAGGEEAVVSAGDTEPAELLAFVLSARPNQRAPVLDRPAVTKEVFRTEDPLSGLRDGPYEFKLVRTTVTPGTSASTPTDSAGVALHYVLAGNGTLTLGDKMEGLVAGAAFYVTPGSAHRLASTGDAPLVILLAEISPQPSPASAR